MDPRFSGVDVLEGRSAARPEGPPLDPAGTEPARASAHRPRVWTSILAVPIAGIMGSVLGLVVALNLGPDAGGRSRASLLEVFDEPGGALAMMIGLQVGNGLTPWIAAKLSPLPWRRRLSWAPARLPWRALAALLATDLGISCAVLIVAAALQGAGLIPLDDPSKDWLAVALFTSPLSIALPLVAASSLLPGFCEELLFRGYMQTGLLARWRPWLAVVVTSAVFAALHGEYAWGIFPGGLWLGYMAWRSGSVFPGMICHFASNAIFQTLGLLTGDRTQPLLPERTPTMVLCIAAGFLLFVALPAARYSIRALEHVARSRADEGIAVAPAPSDSPAR